MHVLSSEVGADGVGLITWDMKPHRVNVLTTESIAAFNDAVERMLRDAAVKSVIVTSAKPVFLAGGDLNRLDDIHARRGAPGSPHDWTGLQKLFRRIETGGKPFVAAINGTALGGGFELCLACHHRVVADNPEIQLGFPEARIGLMPGAGGIQRVVRMLGPWQAAEIVSEQQTFNPQQAQQRGLVDAVVPASSLLQFARSWLTAAPKDAATKLWDKPGFVIPGPDPRSFAGSLEFAALNARHRKATYNNYPNRNAILKTIYEGLFVSMDQALEIESREFIAVLRDPVSRAMVRTQFTNMQRANRLESRPAGVERKDFARIGVLGAGLMGSGIAHVSAGAGIEVILLDINQAAAERGKARIGDYDKREVAKGRMPQTRADETIGRIMATDRYDRLRGADLIVEAVFEDRPAKADVTRRAQEQAGAALFASNTSTLPITSLAQVSLDPGNFVGLHFFSPVQRMQLVEVIRGKATRDETLAHALDFVRQIGKTPIVVNDSRGFYTSRVFMTYTYEGLHMLAEGIAAPLIENAGRASGMPMPPLALSDEVGLDLMYSVAQQTKIDLQDNWKETEADRIVERIVTTEQRPGRKGGRGFYDYGKDGGKSLWPENARLSGHAKSEAGIEELKLRLLSIQALEAARCLEENVITKVEDADIGATLGWGFAPWTGGPLSYVDLIGIKRFVTNCNTLADRYGERFRPNALLIKMEGLNRTFYS